MRIVIRKYLSTSPRDRISLCLEISDSAVQYKREGTTDKPGYNDVVFAQDVYRYTANIIIAMIVIVRITKVLRGPYIVYIVITNIVIAGLVCTVKPGYHDGGVGCVGVPLRNVTEL